MSERVVDWTVANLFRSGDEIHLLHIIPTPSPEVLAGFGAMDPIVTIEPDPAVDAKHVRFTTHASSGLRSRCDGSPLPSQKNKR